MSRPARTWRALLLPLAVLAGSSAAVLAHVRLENPSNGAPLYWLSPGGVSVVINAEGSDDVPGLAHVPALRNAIETWNEVADTEFWLAEDTSPAQQARTDWESDDIHLMLFDEDDSSGYFPSGSGIVALTPLWFYTNGRIIDADVLFNGAHYSFTTSGYPGRYDVQDVATHELGHLTGLDHSGWAGATMYPYVDPRVLLHRSLSEDERTGLQAVYPGPGTAALGAIAGQVRRSGSLLPVAGAHVVACDADGHTAAGALSNGAGFFQLQSLTPGAYTVYARPLDQPVSAGNLTAGHDVEIDFEPGFYAAPVAVLAGTSTNAGILEVGANVTLNLGKNVDRFPLRVIAGNTQVVTLRGTGLVAGSTIEASDPTLTVEAINWLNSLVQVRVIVPEGTPDAHVDLTVTNPVGDVSVLPAALEITPRNPLVDAIAPAGGPKQGGTPLTISGDHFRPGLRVVIGDRMYADGAPGGCTVVDEGTLTLTLGSTVAGQHDVIVIDPSGIEGRLVDGFAALAIPEIDSLFPASGTLTGGTELTLVGQEFDPAMVVRIDGVPQPQVDFEGPGLVRVTTEPGLLAGVQTLEVENPGGELAQTAFAYWPGPDPVLTGVMPAVGSAAGGEVVTVEGANFTADTEVVFGVDPDTGAGGVVAPATVFVDAGTLTVETPPLGAGPAAVMVRQADTGQADALPAAFQVAGGGGGGGCGTLRLPDPGGGSSPRPGDLAAGGAWIALLAALLCGRASRARARLLQV